MDYIQLNNGFKVPQVGMGTSKIRSQEDINSIMDTAVKSGYEMFDTANYYGNEKAIGNYLKDNPKIKDKLIVSTKIWPINYDTDNTKRMVEQSLSFLGVEKLGIVYLHWPSDGFLEAWKVLEDYYEQGLINALAVCNFNENQLDKLLSNAKIKPTINQVELHPLLSQINLQKYLISNNIKILGWAPICRCREKLFMNDNIVKLADKYNKTKAQIVLRWHIEKGNLIIPKSVNPIRIKENIDIFDFSMTKDEVNAIDDLNENYRIGKDPCDNEWLNLIRTDKTRSEETTDPIF